MVRGRVWQACGWLTGVLATVALVGAATGVASAAEPLERGTSGYPVPRFVSLGSSEVNVRMGPSVDHKVKWTFVKKGLPVEVVREFGNWRRVRDADGEEGWVHHALLSGRRTVLVSPWSEGEETPLFAEASDDALPVAYLEPLVLGEVDSCDGAWCAVSGQGWRGVVAQDRLWGVYPDERVD